MLTVNDLAKQANASAQLVRDYTRIGLIQSVEQTDHGNRLYKPKGTVTQASPQLEFCF